MQVDLFRNAQAADAVAALNHASMVSTVLEKLLPRLFSERQRFLPSHAPNSMRPNWSGANILPLSALMAMRSRSDMVFFRLPCAFLAAE